MNTKLNSNDKNTREFLAAYPGIIDGRNTLYSIIFKLLIGYMYIVSCDLSRKSVSNLFFNYELEDELREQGLESYLFKDVSD